MKKNREQDFFFKLFNQRNTIENDLLCSWKENQQLYVHLFEILKQANTYSFPYFHVSTQSNSGGFSIKCFLTEKQFLQNQNFHRENLSSFFSFSLGKIEFKYLVLKHALKCVNYLQAEHSTFLHL